MSNRESIERRYARGTGKVHDKVSVKQELVLILQRIGIKEPKGTRKDLITLARQ